MTMSIRLCGPCGTSVNAKSRKEWYNVEERSSVRDIHAKAYFPIDVV